MTVRIREATPADALAIAGVHVRGWQHGYRGMLTDEYLDGLKPEDRLENTRYILEHPPAEWRTWVAVDGGRVVAFASTGRSEDVDAEARTAEVYAIYLEPEVMGTGVARSLFAHAVDDLRVRGFGTATLWVLETNERARRFYEVAGWKLDGATTSERVDCEMRPTVRYRIEL